MVAAVCICRYLMLADLLVFCKIVLDLPKSVLAKLRRRGFRAPCPCAVLRAAVSVRRVRAPFWHLASEGSRRLMVRR